MKMKYSGGDAHERILAATKFVRFFSIIRCLVDNSKLILH